MRRFWRRFSLLGKTGNLVCMRLKDRVFYEEVLEEVLPSQ
jgi:hypothetical protein